MFLKQFKMTRQPFLERTPVDHLLKDERFTQGLARLKYLAHSGSIALLTGQTGVGKSSLLKLFLAGLSRNRFQPLYLNLTHVKAVGLLKLIVRAFGEVPKRGKENLFLQILEKAGKSETTTILIVDEGHLTEPEALIDLRLLISSGLEDAPPLKLILVGQDALWRELRRTAHADLVHRISVRYHLPPLSEDQTAAYIDFQIRSSGATTKIFEPEAKELIYGYSGGIPRVINNIATAALINAATKNLQKISGTLVNETMDEFRLP